MDFLAENDRIQYPSAIAVGMFDGLHLGHRALIGQLKKDAKDLKTMLFTFCVNEESQSIYTNAEKKALIEKTGVDYARLQAYTRAFLNTEREDFLILLQNLYRMQALTAGEDFRFGKGARGDADYLLKSAKRMGFTVAIVPPVLLDGEKVSSTRIRTLLASGDVTEAGRLLGGYYFISGTVEAGKKIGSLIECPTVNIRTPKLKPKNGVYATFSKIGDRVYKSVTNVGVRPTVCDLGEVNIETNIFDFTCEIYDQQVTVYFVGMIREEMKFTDLEALKSRIEQDKAQASDFLSNKTIYKPD
jgi:riboflavin kinase/FMN adenylyltransferase